MAIGFWGGLAIQVGINLLSNYGRKKRKQQPLDRKPRTIRFSADDSDYALFASGESVIDQPVLVYAGSRPIKYNEPPFTEQDAATARELILAYALSEEACERMTWVMFADDLGEKFVQLEPGQKDSIGRTIVDIRDHFEGNKRYDVLLGGDVRRRIEITEYLNADGQQGLFLQRLAKEARSMPAWDDRFQGYNVSWCVVRMVAPPREFPDQGAMPDVFSGAPRLMFGLQGMKVPEPSRIGQPDAWVNKWTDAVSAQRWFFETKRLGRSIGDFNLASVIDAQERCAKNIKVPLPPTTVRYAFAWTRTNDAPIPPAGNTFPPIPGADNWSYHPGKRPPGFLYLWRAFSHFSPVLNDWTDWGGVIRNYKFKGGGGNGDPRDDEGLTGRPEASVAPARTRSYDDKDDPDTTITEPEVPESKEDAESDDTNTLPPVDVNEDTDYNEALMEVNVARRYGFNTAYRSDTPARDVLDDMDFAWAGRVIEQDGERFFEPGTDKPAIAVLDGSNSSHVSTKPSTSLSERTNQVRAKLRHVRGRHFKWGPYTPDPIANLDTIELDGEVLETDLGEIEFIDTPLAYARIAASHLRREQQAREFIRDVLPGASAEMLRLKLGDNVAVVGPGLTQRFRRLDGSIASYQTRDGRQAVLCSIVGRSIMEGMVPRLHLREIAPHVYQDSAILLPLPIDPDAIDEFPADPTGLETDERATLQKDGVRVISLHARVDPALVYRWVWQWRIVIEEGGAPVEIASKQSEIIEETQDWSPERQLVTETNQIVISNVVEGALYELRVKAWFQNGFESGWVHALERIDEDLDPMRIPLAIEGYGVSGGIKGSWAKPQEPDWKETEVRIGRPGTTWEQKTIRRVVYDTSVEHLFEDGVLLNDPDPWEMMIAHIDLSDNRGEIGIVIVTPLPRATDLLRDYIFVGTKDGFPPEIPMDPLDLPDELPNQHTAYSRIPEEPSAEWPFWWYTYRAALPAVGGAADWDDLRNMRPWAVYADNVIVLPDGAIFRSNVDLQYRRLKTDGEVEGEGTGWSETRVETDPEWPLRQTRWRYRDNG